MSSFVAASDVWACGPHGNPFRFLLELAREAHANDVHYYFRVTDKLKVPDWPQNDPIIIFEVGQAHGVFYDMKGLRVEKPENLTFASQCGGFLIPPLIYHSVITTGWRHVRRNVLKELRTGHWKSRGTTAALDGTPAEAGSDRIYYENTETGEVCYRRASWGTHGTGVHGFRDSGDGFNVQAKLVHHDQVFSASEF